MVKSDAHKKDVLSQLTSLQAPSYPVPDGSHAPFVDSQGLAARTESYLLLLIGCH